MPNADIDIVARGEHYLQLIERQKTAVWGLCLKMARFDVPRAQDMVQEVWIALWQYFGSLRPDSTVEQERRWVLLRARGILYRKARGEGPPLELADQLPDLSAEQEAHSELDERLMRIFDRLDPDERRLMQMHLDGYSFDEIGSALGISAAAARMRKGRIVGQMKRMAKRMNSNNN